MQIINEIDDNGIPTHFDWEKFTAGEVIDVDIYDKNENYACVQFGNGSVSEISIGCFEEIKSNASLDNQLYRQLMQQI